MSKLSNYNLIRLFLPANIDRLKLLNEKINDVCHSVCKVNKCFKFELSQNKNNSLVKLSDKYLVTFNFPKTSVIEKYLQGHEIYKVFRKKETNTLYEINMIPKIIRRQNDNIYDKDYIIDWLPFSNTILLSNNLNKFKSYKLQFKGYVFLEDNK